MVATNTALCRWLHAECDAAALDLIGAVLQDVPQLILQLYLLAHALPILSASITHSSDIFKNLSTHPQAFFTSSSSFFRDWFSSSDISKNINTSGAVGYALVEGKLDFTGFTLNPYILDYDNVTVEDNETIKVDDNATLNGILHSSNNTYTTEEMSKNIPYFSFHVSNETHDGLDVPEELLPETANHLCKYFY